MSNVNENYALKSLFFLCPFSSSSNLFSLKNQLKVGLNAEDSLAYMWIRTLATVITYIDRK